MAERLTTEDVERIAALAHLDLTDQEKALLVRQLTEILGYAEQIQAIDTTGVPPTSHVLSRHPADRLDEAQPSLPGADALANAPDPAPDGGLFRVPRVIG
jgi:aspartyl-tRNA(Asn)/glutamyl-tRNA(Gln) amidotransferase subunit C